MPSSLPEVILVVGAFAGADFLALASSYRPVGCGACCRFRAGISTADYRAVIHYQRIGFAERMARAALSCKPHAHRPRGSGVSGL